jgi:hypothetical protein
MALDPTLKTNAWDNVDRVQYTTASVSIAADRWVVIDVLNTRAAPAPEPVISGLTLTWVKEDSVVSAAGGSERRASKFYARASGAQSGTITIDFGSSTQTGCAWHVYEMNAATNVSDPFVQTVSSAPATTDTSIVVTLASFALTGNRPLIVAFHLANEASTHESGYTELGDVNGSAPTIGFAVAFHPTATDTSPSYSWATTTASRAAIASEINGLLALAGKATAAGSSRGVLTQSIALTGKASASGSARGVLTQAIAVSGKATAANSASGNLTQSTPLAGKASASSAANGTLSQVAALAGTSSASNAAGAHLTSTIYLTGDTAASGSSSGTLGQLVPVSAKALAANSASASLTVWNLLAGSASVSAFATGTFAAPRNLVWIAGRPRSKWAFGEPEAKWTTGRPKAKWEIGAPRQ